MRKKDRQLLIKRLIFDYDIATQEELLTLLKKEGVNATQATISRDIKELNLVKTPMKGGRTKYSLYNDNQTSRNKLEKTIEERVISATQVEAIVVIKTLKGNANVVSALIDDMAFPEVVGTLAGHDTAVIFSKSREDASKFSSYIKQNMSEQPII